MKKVIVVSKTHLDLGFTDPAKGLTFTLHNNICGTNFPLWYGENAYFAFDFALKK